MTYKIQKAEETRAVVLKLSGRIQRENVPDLEQQCAAISGGRDLVLDLEEVKLVDRDVVRFLERCERTGARLRNCPPYIRQWIAQEDERKS